MNVMLFVRRAVAALVDGLAPAAVFVVLWYTVNGGVAYALATVVVFAYFTALEGGPSGQTVGKGLMGLRVRSADGVSEVGYGRAAVRYIGRYVSAALCGLGYFWSLWDSRSQAWHDKIAETVVTDA